MIVAVIGGAVMVVALVATAIGSGGEEVDRLTRDVRRKR